MRDSAAWVAELGHPAAGPRRHGGQAPSTSPDVRATGCAQRRSADTVGSRRLACASRGPTAGRRTPSSGRTFGCACWGAGSMGHPQGVKRNAIRWLNCRLPLQHSANIVDITRRLFGRQRTRLLTARLGELHRSSAPSGLDAPVLKVQGASGASPRRSGCGRIVNNAVIPAREALQASRSMATSAHSSPRYVSRTLSGERVTLSGERSHF